MLFTIPYSLFTTMKVTVKLYGEFRRAAATPEVVLELPEGSVVKDLAGRLRLPETIYKMVLVNGFRVADDRPLRDGDEVHIFQPVGGG